MTGQTGFFILGTVTNLGKRKTEFKPAVLHLKKVDLVSHPAHSGGGWVNIYCKIGRLK